MKLKFLKLGYVAPILMTLTSTVWPQSNLTVTATSVNAQAQAIYHFTFMADREIGSSASIGIVFPSDFDLTLVKMADSRTMNGGLQITVSADTVWARRSGLGKAIASGTRVDLLLAAVVSVEMAQSADFQVLHREMGGGINRSRQRVEIGLYRGGRREN